MSKKNAFYAQSGGVTAVINASACGVIETARKHSDKIGNVYAGRNGIIGALTEQLIDTSRESDEAIAKTVRDTMQRVAAQVHQQTRRIQILALRSLLLAADGDDEGAFAALSESIRGGRRHQTLLGATGTGKSVFLNSFLCSLLEAVLLSITPSFAQLKLQEGGIEGSQLHDLTAAIGSSVTSLLDDTTIIQDGDTEAHPYLTFVSDNDELIHIGENAYTHEFLFDALKKVFG